MQSFQTDDGLRLRYHESGQGRALVLVHGWTMTHQVFQHQIDAFQTTHRVIAPDLRGCGQSDSRAGTYSMPRYAEDLHQLMSLLDLRDATVVGWSMGGGIMMEYLERHGAERVRAVGLVDFPPRLEEDSVVADKVCNSLNTRRDGFLDSFMRRMLLDPSRTDLAAHLRAQADQCKSETACEMYRAMRGTGPARAEPIPLPAFLAFPAQGWFPQALPQWKAKFPNHIAPAFERSKHCPFLEEPERFNQELRGLLGKA